MKRLIAIALVALLSLAFLPGCTGTTTPPATAATTAAAGTTAAATAAATTAAPAGPDWNKMTTAELYELAKKEGGEIGIYTASSRTGKALEKFMAAYPELKAVAYDLGNTEIPKKVEIEAQTKNVTADVIMCSDNAGEISIDFAPRGYIESYQPEDIVKHINPDLLKAGGLPLYASLSYWFYNTKAFPDGCPVKNWWDIIEIKDGKQVYELITKEIGSEISYLSLLTNMVTTPDELAAAYKEKYGKDIEYTYDASQTPGIPANNAAYEFIYRFTQCKMTFIDDGDEIAQSVHNSTKENPRLGLASASKIVNRDENKWDIAWVTEIHPYTNMQNICFLYPTAGCDNPAGARLLMRFLIGGDTGDGDGIKALLKEGNWSIRDDYTFKGNPFAIQDTNAVVPNYQGIYENYYNVQDFWVYWLNKNAK